MYTAQQNSAKILVVDDQAPTRNLVKTILKGNGFNTVILAENGQMAIKNIFDEMLDLVICDWNMPDVTGIEVLRHVRGDPKYEKLPFLMLTAEAYRENITEAMKLGVSGYIVKPFTAEILLSKVISILDKA